MKLARWLLPIVSLAIVLLVTWWDFGGSGAGPGDLHSAHAAVAELRGGRNCEACHRVGAGIDVAGCNSCHGVIGDQLATGTGLHGTLADGLGQRCSSCHGEHHGDSVPLIAPHAFPRAGVADLSAFEHAHVEFGLVGAHAALACERCHPNANAVAPPADGRFVGVSQQCTSCHEDAHRGEYGTACADCHGQQEPWPRAPLFPHEAFALTAAHGAVACSACHAADGPHSVEALQTTPQPVRTCAECHADPHGTADSAPTALRLEGTGDCARCHQPTEWGAARPTAAAHAAFGFELAIAHANVDCAACHGSADTAPRWSGAAPPVAACAACHEHPHRPELVAAATAAQGPANGCGACHSDADAAFGTGRMPPELHAVTGFLLETPHADVACASCHEGQAPAERFPGRVASDCRACHDDVHRGQFDHDTRYAQCTACHLETTFHPAQFDGLAHATTAFPLTGAHDAVACSECHREQAGLRQFHGAPTVCSSCHFDVHGGAFDRPGLPATVAGRSGCERCHDTRAFKPVARFEHGLWAGYELTGAHRELDCATCHPRTNGGLGAAAGARCADCHTDPHAGQFDEHGWTDCARCHVPQSFAELQFDHQRTRFPLDEVHVALDCAKCHKSYETAAGPLVRYRPLGTTCGDCHTLGAKPTGGR
ncbi:MAG: cytochrome c3 family protein [Planctomycetes bacterium]|nr:cytochrome c3 family protein [Planctomycetota bacterium]